MRRRDLTDNLIGLRNISLKRFLIELLIFIFIFSNSIASAAIEGTNLAIATIVLSSSGFLLSLIGFLFVLQYIYCSNHEKSQQIGNVFEIFGLISILISLFTLRFCTFNDIRFFSLFISLFRFPFLIVIFWFLYNEFRKFVGYPPIILSRNNDISFEKKKTTSQSSTKNENKESRVIEVEVRNKE